MKARYCSASARIEIFVRSTFCSRARLSSRSIGPSNPSRSRTSAGSPSRRRLRRRPPDRRLDHPPCPVIVSTKPISASRRHPDQPSQHIDPEPAARRSIGQHEQQQQDQHAVGLEPGERPRQEIRQDADRDPAAVERRQRQHVEDAQHRVDLQRIAQIASQPLRRSRRGSRRAHRTAAPRRSRAAHWSPARPARPRPSRAGDGSAARN